MHWSVSLDALPGSATFVCAMDCWLNDWWGATLLKICTGLPYVYMRVRNFGGF